MQYETFVPDLSLQPAIECYWIVEGTETDWQKITPDGCTELIFHFGEKYKVKHHEKSEELQPFTIAAGQIDKPIFLQPTGKSGVLGIKFTPTGIWKMFGWDMNLLTNKTNDLGEVLKESETILEKIKKAKDNPQRIEVVEKFLATRWSISKKESEIDAVVNRINENHGQDSIQELSNRFDISPRKMERLFNEQVGVSAKLYSRIIRFAHVYKLLKQPALTKAEVTYLSGYFDQAHFNKEFKQFAGENPEAYFTQDHAFSNFFLDR